jgi:hypothetical protein
LSLFAQFEGVCTPDHVTTFRLHLSVALVGVSFARVWLVRGDRIPLVGIDPPVLAVEAFADSVKIVRVGDPFKIVRDGPVFALVSDEPPVFETRESGSDRVRILVDPTCDLRPVPYCTFKINSPDDAVGPESDPAVMSRT